MNLSVTETPGGLIVEIDHILPRRQSSDMWKKEYRHTYNVNAEKEEYVAGFQEWIQKRKSPFKRYTEYDLSFEFVCKDLSGALRNKKLPDLDNIDVKPIIDVMSMYVYLSDNPLCMKSLTLKAKAGEKNLTRIFIKPIYRNSDS